MKDRGKRMILRLTLDLPGDYPYLRLARRIGRTVMEDFGVDRTDVDDVEFVLGELCSNVVRHARSSDGRFVVELEYGADNVAVNVIDKGVGFSFKDVQPAGSPRADFDGSSRIGGFGLDLCRKLADHLEFQRSDKDGTAVRAVKQLHYVSTHEAAEAKALEQSSPGGLITISGANVRDGR